VWNSPPGWFFSLGTMSPEPPLCKMTRAAAVVLRTHTTLRNHHSNSCCSSRIQLYWICPNRPSSTSIAHFQKCWFSKSFNDTRNRALPEILLSACKPQTTSDSLSKSLTSLKTVFLSLNTHCRSNRLRCKIHHQLNAQLWTAEQLEYHDRK